MPAPGPPVLASPLRVPAPGPPASPPRVLEVDVQRHGGVGDGAFDNTALFRSCAALCAKHVGTTGGACDLVVPPGVYVTGAFNLTSHVRLVIKEGAVVKAVPFSWEHWRFHWPPVRVPSGYASSRDACCVPWRYALLDRGWQHSPLIGGYNVTDVSIVGQGAIDGNGLEWWRRFLCAWLASAAQLVGVNVKLALGAVQGWQCGNVFEEDEARIANAGYAMGRPRLVEFAQSTRVVLKGLTFKDSAFWTLHLVDSRNVLISDVSISAPGTVGAKAVWAPNSDGVDVDSCEDVVIENCVVDVGDDAVAVKSGLGASGREHGKPSSDITIRNSRLASQWVSIGSEMSGGVSNVVIENCTLGRSAISSEEARTNAANTADVYTAAFVAHALLETFRPWTGDSSQVPHGGAAGLHIKTRRGRGGLVDRVRMVKCTIFGSDAALWVSTSYPGEALSYPGDSTPADDLSPAIRNVVLEDVTCTRCLRAFDVVGLPEMPLAGLTMKNVRTDATYAPRCINVKGFTSDAAGVVCQRRAQGGDVFVVTVVEHPLTVALFSLATCALTLSALRCLRLARRRRSTRHKSSPPSPSRTPLDAHVARKRPPGWRRAAVGDVVLFFAFASSLVYASLWLGGSHFGVDSTLSAPLSLTPAPVLAPFLHAGTFAPSFFVTLSLSASLAALFALASNKHRSATLKCAFAVKALATVVHVLALVLFPGAAARSRAAFCAARWNSAQMAPRHLGDDDGLLGEACAQHLALGEPAALAIGLATTALLGAICLSSTTHRSSATPHHAFVLD